MTNLISVHSYITVSSVLTMLRALAVFIGNLMTDPQADLSQSKYSWKCQAAAQLMAVKIFLFAITSIL